jgi:hypothetical protein
MRLGGILAAAAVIVITNGVVLLEVARNRAGGAIETIRLTERELPLGFREKENTGVAVGLNWQRLSFVANDYPWLDRTKLEGLGFDYAKALRDPQHPPLPRPAFVALEYNGPAWEQWLNSAALKDMPNDTYSRLFPIDVARTPEPLLRKYPNREKYLVVRGLVQLSAVTRQGQLQLLPSISQLFPAAIHVPSPLSDPLNVMVGTNPTSPRYTITLSYGRSFEPWVVRIDQPGSD